MAVRSGVGGLCLLIYDIIAVRRRPTAWGVALLCCIMKVLLFLASVTMEKLAGPLHALVPNNQRECSGEGRDGRA